MLHVLNSTKFKEYGGSAFDDMGWMHVYSPIPPQNMATPTLDVTTDVMKWFSAVANHSMPVGLVREYWFCNASVRSEVSKGERTDLIA